MVPVMPLSKRFEILCFSFLPYLLSPLLLLLPPLASLPPPLLPSSLPRSSLFLVSSFPPSLPILLSPPSPLLFLILPYLLSALPSSFLPSSSLLPLFPFPPPSLRSPSCYIYYFLCSKNERFDIFRTRSKILLVYLLSYPSPLLSQQRK